MKLLRNCLTAVLAAVFLFSTGMVLRLMWENHMAEESRARAQSLALADTAPQQDPAPENAPAAAPIIRDPVEALPLTRFTSDLPKGSRLPKPEPKTIADPLAIPLGALDLAPLTEINSDVVGWIHIPGTGIDYPIVHGADNDYYLLHTWDGYYSSAGAVFMEATHAPDFSGFSTILYAHNSQGGGRFGALRSYRYQEFWEGNPYVYLVTASGCFRYRIYAAYEAELTAPTYWSRVDTPELQQVFLDYGMNQSWFETDRVPENGAPVLTLSTCTGYTNARRWVVQAVLEGPIEAPAE